MSAEGSEEIGEEGALGWHCCAIHEEDARRLDAEGKRAEYLGRNQEFTESSDCGVDTLYSPLGRGVNSV